MDWHRWLYILLIILSGVTTERAWVVSAQTQTAPPARQADPENAEQVALGQQVYASFLRRLSWRQSRRPARLAEALAHGQLSSPAAR